MCCSLDGLLTYVVLTVRVFGGNVPNVSPPIDKDGCH